MIGEVGKKLDAHLLMVIRSQLWDQGLQCACVCSHLIPVVYQAQPFWEGNQCVLLRGKPNIRSEIPGSDW